MWQQLKIVSNIEKLLTISVVEYEGGCWGQMAGLVQKCDLETKM